MHLGSLRSLPALTILWFYDLVWLGWISHVFQEVDTFHRIFLLLSYQISSRYNSTYARIASDQKHDCCVDPSSLGPAKWLLEDLPSKTKIKASKEMPFCYKISLTFHHWMLQHGVWCILLTRKFPCWKTPYDVNKSKNCEELLSWCTEESRKRPGPLTLNTESRLFQKQLLQGWFLR